MKTKGFQSWFQMNKNCRQISWRKMRRWNWSFNIMRSNYMRANTKRRIKWRIFKKIWENWQRKTRNFDKKSRVWNKRKRILSNMIRNWKDCKKKLWPSWKNFDWLIMQWLFWLVLWILFPKIKIYRSIITYLHWTLIIIGLVDVFDGRVEQWGDLTSFFRD